MLNISLACIMKKVCVRVCTCVYQSKQGQLGCVAPGQPAANQRAAGEDTSCQSLDSTSNIKGIFQVLPQIKKPKLLFLH